MNYSVNRRLDVAITMRPLTYYTFFFIVVVCFSPCNHNSVFSFITLRLNVKNMLLLYTENYFLFPLTMLKFYCTSLAGNLLYLGLMLVTKFVVYLF